MPTFQSELDGGDGIADELAASQRSISIAEFFEKNKHMLGFDSGARALVTAVKEAVDNALDATEEAGILPDIYIEIEEAGDYYRLVVEDNGPGITKAQVPKVFGKLLYGSRFHAREQSRGQQGIGISAAVLFSQLTSGKPAKITSKPEGRAAQYFELIIDTDSNEPSISVARETEWERPHGTRIELEMEATLRARAQLTDYIKHTAVVNPHARVEFHEPDESQKFERATDQLPAETEEIRPHPHGVELGSLIKMLEVTDSYSVSGFLQAEFTRVGKKTAARVVDAFRDRQFGRELAWTSPQQGARASYEAVIRESVSNKGSVATERFAELVLSGPSETDGLADRATVSYGELVTLVEAAADAVETAQDRRFGETVRENAVAAVWYELRQGRAADLYGLIDDATTDRKDDAAVEALARRLDTKFEETDEPRDRLREGQLREWLEWAADRTKQRENESFGETAQKKIMEALWARSRAVVETVPDVRSACSDRDVAARLLEAMRETDILAPPTDCLAPITADLVEAGLRKEFDAGFFAASSRDADVHGGDPFIVEAGIAYGGEIEVDGQAEILRFANRVPLVYQRGACGTVDVIKGINWRNYNLDQPGGRGIPNGPCVIMIHVASTNVPFTSESKDAIANIPAIEDEVELALREVGRELKSYLNRKRSLERRQEKQDVIATILPEMATKVAEVTGRDGLYVEDSLARIMNNVLVERRREQGAVSLVVSNHDERTAALEITDILSEDPGELGDASVVEMDGEWFVSWNPTVEAGEQRQLAYEIPEDTEFDLRVEGVEQERLTIDAS
jgi:DNA topoisomerase-6 subunit B